METTRRSIETNIGLSTVHPIPDLERRTSATDVTSSCCKNRKMMLDGSMRDHCPDWRQFQKRGGSSVLGGAGAGPGCSEDEGDGLGLGSGHGVSAESEDNRTRSGRDGAKNGNDMEMVAGNNANVSGGVTAVADLAADQVHGGLQPELGGSSGGIDLLQPGPQQHFYADLEGQPKTTLLEVYYPLQWPSYYHFPQHFQQHKQEQQAYLESQSHFPHPPQPPQEQLQEQPPIRQEQPQACYVPAPFYNLSAGFPPMSLDNLSGSSIFLPPNSSLPRRYQHPPPRLEPSDDSSVDTVRNLHDGLSQLLTTDSSPTTSHQLYERINFLDAPQPYVGTESDASTASSSSDAASPSPVITSPDTTPSSGRASRDSKRSAASIPHRKTQPRVPSPSSQPMTPAATPTGQGDSRIEQPIASTNAASSEPSQPDPPPQLTPGKRDREEGDSEEEENGQDEVPQDPEEPRPKKRRGRPRGRPRLTETIDEASAAEVRSLSSSPVYQHEQKGCLSAALWQRSESLHFHKKVPNQAQTTLLTWNRRNRGEGRRYVSHSVRTATAKTKPSSG